MAANRKVNDTSREEDLRDCDTRNIDRGWPYADQPGATSDPVDNAAYGDPAANFDRERNGGYRIIDDADAGGVEKQIQAGVLPNTPNAENSDDLEERITDALYTLDIIDIDSIDVHVDKGKVTLEGVVDDAPTARRITRAIEGIAGVRTVTNNIRLAGVDSRIPDDD